MSVATVKDVEQKTTQKGKAYWRVSLAGIGWASTFDPKVGKLCTDHKGRDIEVATEQQGNFTNITSASAITSGDGETAAPRDTLIVRQVALKAAVEYANALRPTVTSTTDDIIQNAEVFAAWVLRAQEPPEPFDPEAPI